MIENVANERLLNWNIFFFRYTSLDFSGAFIAFSSHYFSFVSFASLARAHAQIADRKKSQKRKDDEKEYKNLSRWNKHEYN